MFPWVWELENDGGAVWLLSSADGWTWSRVPGGPVVSPGKWGEPDGAFVTCTGNLLEYPGDKWGIGYSGNPIPHKYPGRDLAQRKGLFPGVPGVSGLATWPKGRLVALQADGEGEFATVFIVPPTERLRVNADVAPSGYLKMAIRVWGAERRLARAHVRGKRPPDRQLAGRARDVEGRRKPSTTRASPSCCACR